VAILGKTVLAVVPARGGSKGIKDKNLRVVAGRSLVAHAAASLAGLEWIDRAVLSTDDPRIAEEGLRCGLEVPFMRPAELATDLADAIDMWRHAWLASEAYYGIQFDVSVLIQPTTPTRLPEDIEAAARLLITSHAKAVASVSRTPGHYTPEKTLRIDEEGRLHPYLKDGLKYVARQMIPTYYYRNGLVYAVTRTSLIDERNLMEHECLPLVIERDIANIDEPIDLEWAEFLMTRDTK
jgi:CMP-N,N'-diacetyllegionaminic acid synthase